MTVERCRHRFKDCLSRVAHLWRLTFDRHDDATATRVQILQSRRLLDCIGLPSVNKNEYRLCLGNNSSNDGWLQRAHQLIEYSLMDNRSATTGVVACRCLHCMVSKRPLVSKDGFTMQHGRKNEIYRVYSFCILVQAYTLIRLILKTRLHRATMLNGTTRSSVHFPVGVRSCMHVR